MSRIIALFANWKEAEKAMQTLTNTNLGRSEIHIVSEWGADPEQLNLVIVPVSPPRVRYREPLSHVLQLGQRQNWPAQVMPQNSSNRVCRKGGDSLSSNFLKRNIKGGQ